MKIKIYMKVSKDQYELPEVVSDSLEELSEKTGVKKKSIQTLISHKCRGWVRVELED